MKLIHGDCLEEMDKLIKEKIIVDAVICDPPYQISACAWDKMIPFPNMWERLNKLIKTNGAIVLFGNESFSSALRMSNINNYKYDWIWVKSNVSGYMNAKSRPLKNQENISVFSLSRCDAAGGEKNMCYFPQGLTDIHRVRKRTNKIRAGRRSQNLNKINLQTKTGYPKNTIFFSSAIKTVHQTQKPVSLMEYLIKTYTQENETILDFTMGSGTTAVAALNTNRHCIGIEKDEKYFKIAQERIEQTKKDMEYDLFYKEDGKWK